MHSYHFHPISGHQKPIRQIWVYLGHVTKQKVEETFAAERAISHFCCAFGWSERLSTSPYIFSAFSSPNQFPLHFISCNGYYCGQNVICCPPCYRGPKIYICRNHNMNSKILTFHDWNGGTEFMWLIPAWLLGFNKVDDDDDDNDDVGNIMLCCFLMKLKAFSKSLFVWS